MFDHDIRWKQRFQNFEKSLHFLEEALAIPSPDIIQQAGLIQFFEISFELSWKTLKDYLEEQGYADIKSPRDTIKTAFQNDLISNGHGWILAMESRNLSAHTYDREMAKKMVKTIRNDYYPLLKALFDTLKSR